MGKWTLALKIGIALVSSERVELEITDVNESYLSGVFLNVSILVRGYA
jgi:dTDP-glucose pyrophosphorylase